MYLNSYIFTLLTLFSLFFYSVSRCCAWLLLRWPWSSPLSRTLHLHSPLWPLSSLSTSLSWCSLCQRYKHLNNSLLCITSTFMLVCLYADTDFPFCLISVLSLSRVSFFCYYISVLGLRFDLNMNVFPQYSKVKFILENTFFFKLLIVFYSALTDAWFWLVNHSIMWSNFLYIY